MSRIIGDGEVKSHELCPFDGRKIDIHKNMIINSYVEFCKILGEPFRTNAEVRKRQMDIWSKWISFERIEGTNKYIITDIMTDMFLQTDATNLKSILKVQGSKKGNVVKKDHPKDYFLIIKYIQGIIANYLYNCENNFAYFSPIFVMRAFERTLTNKDYNELLASDVFNLRIESVNVPVIPDEIIECYKIALNILEQLVCFKLIYKKETIFIENIGGLREASPNEIVEILAIERGLLRFYGLKSLNDMFRTQDLIDDYYESRLKRLQELGIYNCFVGEIVYFDRNEIDRYRRRMFTLLGDDKKQKGRKGQYFENKEEYDRMAARSARDRRLKYLNNFFFGATPFGFQQIKMSDVSATFMGYKKRYLKVILTRCSLGMLQMIEASKGRTIEWEVDERGTVKTCLVMNGKRERYQIRYK